MVVQIFCLVGICIYCLNVGGGFLLYCVNGVVLDLVVIFVQICCSVVVFVDVLLLVCELGWVFCGDVFLLIICIKVVCDFDIFLNDGVYGGLIELFQIGNLDRIEVLMFDGQLCEGMVWFCMVFGLICDLFD